MLRNNILYCHIIVKYSFVIFLIFSDIYIVIPLATLCKNVLISSEDLFYYRFYNFHIKFLLIKAISAINKDHNIQ